MKRANIFNQKIFKIDYLKTRNNCVRNFLVFPIIMLFVTLLIAIERVRLFYAAGWPDPFYYIGYATNFRALQLRDGPTYTATRIPAILLLKIQNYLGIGDQNFRLLLISLALFCSVALLTRVGKTSYVKAILISAFVTNNLIFLRHISDDYSSNFGMLLEFPFFYICFSLMSGLLPRRKIFLFLGFLIAMIIFCNFSSLICFLPILVITFYHLRQINRNYRVYLAWTLFGIFIGFCLVIASSLYFGSFLTFHNFISLLGSIISIQSTQNGLWTKSLNSVSGFLILFYTVFIFWLGQYKFNFWNFFGNRQVFSIRPKSNKEITLSHQRIIGSTFFTILTGIVFHLIFKGPWLSYSFYACFYLPLILLSISFELRKCSILLITLFLLVEILFFRLFATDSITKFFVNTTRMRIDTIIFLLFFSAIWCFSLYLRHLLPFFICLVFVLAPYNETWSGYTLKSAAPISGEYTDFAKSWSFTFQEDVQTIALRFSNYVRKSIPERETLWLVYPSEYSWLTSISSTQLYGYSCFHCQDLNPPIKTVKDLVNLNPFVSELASRRNVLILSPQEIFFKKEVLLSPNQSLRLQQKKYFSAHGLKLFVYLFR